jgi:hypothetical protein
MRTATPGRIGRPAQQDVMALIVLAAMESATGVSLGPLGDLHRTEADRSWFVAPVLQGWAPRELGEREVSPLESAWVLRVATLATPFGQSLIEVTPHRAEVTPHFAACEALVGMLQDLMDQEPEAHPARLRGAT